MNAQQFDADLRDAVADIAAESLRAACLSVNQPLPHQVYPIARQRAHQLYAVLLKHGILVPQKEVSDVEVPA